MRRVTSIKALSDYRLALTFDDGVTGTVDLSYLVGKGVFGAWREPHVFEQVRIGANGEVVWGDSIDLCPDSLYLKVTGETPEEMFPALRHQHTHACSCFTP